MNHSYESGNSFTNQDNFNIYEGITESNYQDDDEGRIKLKHICEHLLHLLNEKGNFSPTTQRLINDRDLTHKNFYSSSKKVIPLHKRNDSYISKHKKRKSDGITPDTMRSILVDVNQNESISLTQEYNDCNNSVNLKTDHFIPNYGNFQGQPIRELNYSDSPSINIDQEISPTVSPLPITYPSDIEYELSSMAIGEEIKYDNSSDFLQQFNNDEFSQEYDNFYFNEF